ncbi:hypothetical protein Tco_1001518 [Tanacetum coccineum]
MNKSMIEVVCNDKGERFGGKEFANKFVKHFNAFLGTKDNVSPIEDSVELFSIKLTKEEAKWMVREIGNRTNVSMWNDHWAEMGVLSNYITHRSLYTARLSSNLKVADMIENGCWK